MRKRIFVLILVVASLSLVANASSNFLSRDEKEAASLAWEACNEKTQPWKRANLAAQAHSLDKRWLRLSDAANGLVAKDNLFQNRDSWVYASGNDGGALYFQLEKMKVQFLSECTTVKR